MKAPRETTMKKIAALAGVAALALGVGSAQARNGADDAHPHKHHKHHHVHHARHGHGADDGPNHT
jgi:hypothetical protein